MRPFHLLLLLPCVVAGLSEPAGAQGVDSVRPPEAPGIVDPAETATAQALREVHRTNRASIIVAAMAMDRGDSRLVRRYAERVYRDHRFSDRQVQELARDIDLSLGPVPNARQARQLVPQIIQSTPRTDAERDLRQVVQRLQGLQGSAFDQAFLRAMSTRQERAQEQLRRLQTEADNRDVRSFVAALVPILDQHVDLALIVDLQLKRAGREAQEEAAP